ncbi:hypothetical protein AB4225_37575 [Streptomyces sp. 2RAF24]|uniref:hypothetical protein n=1 Tax=Streptomyces sp. 2RAF24 TaxID=3232997 RepID=UPI003F9DD900
MIRAEGGPAGCALGRGPPLAAARGGAEATAVAISRASAATARFNAVLHGCRIRVFRGDLTTPAAGERLDLVTVDPPYAPTLPTVLSAYT